MPLSASSNRPYDIVLPLSKSVGIKLPGLKWVLNRHPFWVTVIYWAISPGIMNLNDYLFVHGRFLHPNEQWLSALLDIALGVALGVMAAMLRNLPWEYFPDWLRSWKTHAVCMIIPVVVGAQHVIQEQASSPIGDVWKGMNWIYHNLFLYLLIGYPAIILLLAVLRTFFNKQTYQDPKMIAGLILGMVLVVGCVIGWIKAGEFDRDHQLTPSGVSKHRLANPGPLYNGVIPQFIREIVD